jgi:hypothetical protein
MIFFTGKGNINVAGLQMVIDFYLMVSLCFLMKMEICGLFYVFAG